MTTDIEPKAIDLVVLATTDTELQMKVREIRNESNVRKWMYTDHVIGANEHLGWINRLKKDDRQIVFVVLDDKQTPLGVVSVNDIDRLHKKTDWAFYLTESARSGLGSALELSVIDFVFGSLELEKLNCEVIEGNDAVVKMHKKFLFQEEGFRRSNILRDGNRVGVHFLGLTKDDWIAGQDEIRDKYKWVREKFSVSVHWNQSRGLSEAKPIDQIEEARAKNNLNWMSILRLALEISPETAKPIVSDIKRIDREISDLADKLTEESQ